MSTENIKCTPGNILVELIEESQTQDGFKIPDSDKQKTQIGKVLVVGPLKTKDLEAARNMMKDGLSDEDIKKILCPVEVGDIVIFKQWVGTIYKEKYIFLDFDDIKGVIDEKNI